MRLIGQSIAWFKTMAGLDVSAGALRPGSGSLNGGKPAVAKG
jgi:hypothetical protein